jgi:hypothetical protein
MSYYNAEEEARSTNRVPGAWNEDGAQPQQPASARLSASRNDIETASGLPVGQRAPVGLRQNQWFVLGDGIAREVITADIQRYLGPDALVRPGVGVGEYQGQPGYWITAYRTLTSQMIQDLKLDSERWRQERQPGDGRGGISCSSL